MAESACDRPPQRLPTLPARGFTFLGGSPYCHSLQRARFRGVWQLPRRATPSACGSASGGGRRARTRDPRNFYRDAAAPLTSTAPPRPQAEGVVRRARTLDPRNFHRRAVAPLTSTAPPHPSGRRPPPRARRLVLRPRDGAAACCRPALRGRHVRWRARVAPRRAGVAAVRRARERVGDRAGPQRPGARAGKKPAAPRRGRASATTTPTTSGRPRASWTRCPR